MRRRLIPMFLLIGLLTQGFLCGGSPTQSAWVPYTEAIDGILNDYDGKKGEPAIKADEAVTQLEKTVIPKLDELADRASRIKVPGSPTLTRMHAPLSEAMAAKAEAYKLVTKAYRSRDTDMFDKGIVKLTEASEKLSGFLKEYREAKAAGGPRE